MQRVLITGSTGFLGSALVQALLSNFEVVAVVRKGSDTWRLQNCIDHQNLKIITPDSIEQVFRTQSFNVVIHTATAYGRLGESKEDIEQVNTKLPSFLWDLCQKYATECFINADTFMPANTSMDDKYYTYAQTKKKFLEYVKSHQGVNCKFVNLVLYHMYGPQDNPSKFLPWVIEQFQQSARSIEFTPGDQVRDFIYISDVVDAFMQACRKYSVFKTFSEFYIGTGQRHTIREMVELLQQEYELTTELVWGKKPYPLGEIHFSIADSTKNTELDWVAHVSLRDGLQKTVEYYKKNE